MISFLDRRTGLVALALILSASGTVARDDLSWVRGANYVPSYATTDVEIWLNYNPEAIERELGYAEKLKLNSLRVFLQYLVWQDDPKRFMANLEDFVARCERHGIRPMLVLFDSCFGADPSLESSGFWVANPGPSRMTREFWPEGDKYIRDVVGHFRGDRRVLIWDVMNEPQATWLMADKDGRKAIWDFCLHFLDLVQELDPETPATVGVIGHAYEEVAGKVDVLSLHSYAGTTDKTLEEMRRVKHDSARLGKPAVITECCSVGNYGSTLAAARDLGLGWYLWELMIGRDQFSSYQGLVYPDGKVRRWDAIRAVLGEEPSGFEVKSDAEGVIPDGGRGFGAPIRAMMARLLRSPTTAENLRERYTFLSGLARVGFFNEFEPDETWVAEVESHQPAYAPQPAARELTAVDRLLEKLHTRVRQYDASKPPEKTVLAIFAHPDDEIMVGPVLAKYAREGARVHLAVATSGQQGKRAGIETPRGAPLGRARESEVICSCRELGIRPAVLLRLWDGQVANKMRPLAAAVQKLFETLQPQVVITWGPEVLYGHPDHRMVSNVVTEVFQSRPPGQGWPEALYYPGVPAGRLKKTPPPEGSVYHPVAEDFLPIRVPYTEVDFERSVRALECHDTQFSPEQIQEMMQFKKVLDAGEAHLRPWFGSTERKSDLFQ